MIKKVTIDNDKRDSVRHRRFSEEQQEDFDLLSITGGLTVLKDHNIRESLVKGEDSRNIFSGELEPYNSDYFKSLWSKYRAQSKVLEEHQTLYSFRHTGAIDIFKRTGSLTKLQKAMGHSSLNVSLTYLRWLEVAELQEEDMPMISPF